MRPINCSVGGCLRPPFRRGWCEAHYQQARSGAPLRPLRLRRPGAKRVSVGRVAPEVAAKLDARAKARHITRIMLVDAIFSAYLAREAE